LNAYQRDKEWWIPVVSVKNNTVTEILLLGPEVKRCGAEMGRFASNDPAGPPCRKVILTWVSSINDNGGFHRLVVVFVVIIQIEQKR
jgi:hypothetical protein